MPLVCLRQHTQQAAPFLILHRNTEYETAFSLREGLHSKPGGCQAAELPPVDLGRRQTQEDVAITVPTIGGLRSRTLGRDCVHTNRPRHTDEPLRTPPAVFCTVLYR